MRGVMKPLLACSLLWPLFALADVVDAHAARVQCSADSASQADMHHCLVGRAKAAADDLSKAQVELRDRLGQWDEDKGYVDKAKARATAADKRYLAYRSAECDFAYSLGGGAVGNALDLRKLACQQELDSQRAVQIRSAAEEIPQR